MWKKEGTKKECLKAVGFVKRYLKKKKVHYFR